MKRLLRMLAPAGLLLASGAVASTAFAQGHMGPPGGHGGPGGPGEIGQYVMLLHNLNLTTAQQDSLHGLMDSQRSEVAPLLQQLRTGHDSLNAKIYAAGSGPSLSDLTSAQAQLDQIHSQIFQSEAQTLLKIRALLTSEQLSQLSTLHSQLESLRQQTDALLKPPSATP